MMISTRMRKKIPTCWRTDASKRISGWEKPTSVEIFAPRKSGWICTGIFLQWEICQLQQTPATTKESLFTWMLLMLLSFWAHKRLKRRNNDVKVLSWLKILHALITLLSGTQKSVNMIPSRLQEHFRPPASQSPLPEWCLVSCVHHLSSDAFEIWNRGLGG